ncbi:unnamed protein product, partial [Mesorhabditis belari]|uniref:SCP domain-containing protein n=2 Tax=Mesorhabditis belari TaxID=2138241 RepID=A0AAF3ER62_9BILA
MSVLSILAILVAATAATNISGYGPPVIGAAAGTGATAVPYTAAVANYILAQVNQLRSNVAWGRQSWHNSSNPSNSFWPPAKKLYSLKWNATLATTAAQWMDARGDTFGAGEINVGFWAGTAGVNTITGQQMFEEGWNNWWYGYLTSTGVPTFNYQYKLSTTITRDQHYQNQVWMFVGENALSIGCAYKNYTSTYRITCLLQTNGGMTNNSPPYNSAATPCEICSLCPPTTAPCGPARGLCIAKAAG